jgi:hypothetical protein
VCVAPLHWVSLILRCVMRYSSFISRHNTVQKVGGVFNRHGHFKHTLQAQRCHDCGRWNSALSYGSYLTRQHCHFWKKKVPLIFTGLVSLLSEHPSYTKLQNIPVWIVAQKNRAKDLPSRQLMRFVSSVLPWQVRLYARKKLKLIICSCKLMDDNWIMGHWGVHWRWQDKSFLDTYNKICIIYTIDHRVMYHMSNNEKRKKVMD